MPFFLFMKIDNYIKNFKITVFLLFGILFFPFYLFVFSKSAFGISYIRFSTFSTLSLLAAAYIFINLKVYSGKLKSRSILYLPLLLLFLISIVHFFLYKSYSILDFGFSICWLTIPLFVCFYTSSFKKILPFYLSLLWILDLAHSFYQTAEKTGICGNRNWHAIFLVVCIIFSIYSTKKLIFKFNKSQDKTAASFFTAVIILLDIVFIVYSLFLIYRCESKGAWLAFISALCIYLFFVCKAKISKHKEKLQTISTSQRKKIIVFSGILISLLCLLFIFFRNFPKYNTAEQNAALRTSKTLAQMEKIFNDDVRIPLWYGTLQLIATHPFLGVGASRFETEYAAYRPISYFLKPNAATRSNHPHNIILYIMACYGIPGFMFWAVLYIYPLIYCLIKFRLLDSFEKYTLFAYFCLLLHGLFDLIMFVWPTLFIALILVGILWKKTWDISSEPSPATASSRPNKLLYSASFAIGIILLCYTFYSCYNQLMGSYYCRNAYYFALNKENNTALSYYNKGLAYKKIPKFIYKAALLSLTEMNSPNLALRFFNYFNTIPTHNYAHNNGFIAICLMKKGELKAALPFLYKEVINYPMSTGAWYRLLVVQKFLGLKKAAAFSKENMYKTIEYKELPKSALKLLLENPEYDKHPRSIPKAKLKQLEDKNLKEIKNL